MRETSLMFLWYLLAPLQNLDRCLLSLVVSLSTFIYSLLLPVFISLGCTVKHVYHTTLSKAYSRVCKALILMIKESLLKIVLYTVYCSRDILVIWQTICIGNQT